MSDVKTAIGELPEFLTRVTQEKFHEPTILEGERKISGRLGSARWQAVRSVIQGQMPRITTAVIGFAFVGLGWQQLHTNGVGATNDAVYNAKTNSPIGPTASPNNDPIESTEIVVNVSGAVKESGLYKLPTDARVGEAVQSAGGLSGSADAAFVQKEMNLADILQDGDKVYVPHQGETELEALISRENLTDTSGAVTPIIGVSAKNLVQDSAEAAETSQRVSINVANQAELDELPGIGAARATAIIEGRPYQSIEDLVGRKVLPPSVYAQIEGLIGL